MRIKMKHFWGILLSLSMVIGLIPSPGTVLQVEAATSVGDLSALKNALANGGEVSLWRDISGSTTNIYLENETTLDLNARTLTLSGSIDPKASFTIKNGTFNGSSNSQAPLQVWSGKTTIDNVTISNDYRAISNANPGSVEILSGTINGPINNSSNGGTFTISGGTINNYIRNAGKNLIISDGVINGEIKQEFDYAGGSLTISGGTINDNITIKINTTPTVTITGGRFKVFDPTPYVPQGYTVTIEGDYKVVGPAYTALDTNGSTTPVTIAISNSHTTPQIGDTLTASCDASNLIYQWYRGDVVIEGATSTTYTITAADIGSTIKVVVKQTKQSNGSDYASGSEPTKESAATAAVIKNTAATPSLDDARTNAGISYVNETVVPDGNYQVSSSNSEYVAVSSLRSILDGEGTPTIYVRTKETNDTQASEWVAVTLTTRPAAPSNLGSTNATNTTSTDGTITGVSSSMEYSADDSSWSNITSNSISGLTSGTYHVRVKATDNSPHGVAATVTVGSNYTPLDTVGNTTPVNIKKGDTALSGAPVVGDVLTVSCDATDLIYEWFVGGVSTGAASTINTSYTINVDGIGKAITVKVTQTKQADGTLYADGSEPTQISDATAAVVKKSSPVAPANAAATGFVINYIEETFTVSTPYEASTTQSDAGLISDGSLTSAIDSAGHKVYIRAKETDDTQASAWLEVNLPSRPDAPTGLTSENATDSSTTDGKIKGTTALMEYSQNNGTTWIDATATETAVKPGTYLVRVKATESAPHGLVTEVTVGSKEIILSDEQKPTGKTGLTYTGSEHALINAPAVALPEGTTEMRYAIGMDATTVPTDGWSESIPTGNEAKT